MHRIPGGRGATCIAAASVLFLTGCAAPTSDKATPSPPVLRGPWAADFLAAFNDSDSAYERGVLRDGIVTKSELEEAHGKVDTCLRDSDLTVTYFDDGGFEVGSTVGRSPSNDIDRTNSVLEGCEARYDRSVTALFEQTRRNPENLDDAKITVACLRAARLVGADYSEQQWRDDYDADTLPFNGFDPMVKQCDLDPLGLWRTP